MSLNRISIATVAALLVTALSAFYWRTPSQHVFAILCAEYLILLPAVMYALRSPGTGAAAELPRMSRAGLIAGFLAVALTASWFENQGQLIPDEAGYQFQAKIFALGEFWASPPPGAPVTGAVTPAPLYFEHLIMDQDRWLTVYPWGWPAVLAVAQLLHIPWAANPLLGAALLLLIAAIAGRLYGARTGMLALLMGVMSPYFLANCIGQMSHPATSVLLAGACLFYLQGIRTARVAPFAWMLALTAAAFQIRPFTAAIIGGTLGFAALWHFRRERLRVHLLALGGLCCAACVGSFFAYTKLSTGSWRSPYLYFQSASGAQVDLRPLQLVHNLTHQTRWAVLETAFYSFPFLFLLAAYAIWREREYVWEARVLGALSLVLVLAYLVQAGVSVEFIGERYYFESFFAVLILAARGVTLLMNEHRFGQRAFTAVLGLLVAFEIGRFVLAAPVFWTRIQPYRQVLAATERLGDKRYTVFLHDGEPFVAKHLNPNRADWHNGSQMFLIDPEPVERDTWACRMDRPEWVVIGYDQAHATATEEFGSARACPPR